MNKAQIQVPRLCICHKYCHNVCSRSDDYGTVQLSQVTQVEEPGSVPRLTLLNEWGSQENWTGSPPRPVSPYHSLSSPRPRSCPPTPRSPPPRPRSCPPRPRSPPPTPPWPRPPSPPTTTCSTARQQSPHSHSLLSSRSLLGAPSPFYKVSLIFFSFSLF